MDESLPRSQPPPPPSPQPKHLSQATQMPQSRERTQDLPEVAETPADVSSLDTDGYINRQYGSKAVNERTSVMGGPLLMPPSAFTKSDLLGAESSPGHIHGNEHTDSIITDSGFPQQQQVLIQADVPGDNNPAAPVSLVPQKMSNAPSTVSIHDDRTKHHFLSPDAFMSKDTPDDVFVRHK